MVEQVATTTRWARTATGSDAGDDHPRCREAQAAETQANVRMRTCRSRWLAVRTTATRLRGRAVPSQRLDRASRRRSRLSTTTSRSRYDEPQRKSARDKVTASFASTEAALEAEAAAASAAAAGDESQVKKEADVAGDASKDAAVEANASAAGSAVPAPAAAAMAGSPSAQSAAVGTPTLSNASPRMASIPGATPPDWLTQSGAALKARYPNDRFEIQQRPRPAGVPPPPQPEWRVRCLDCPGKLYTPGPGESLNNFEIHLRNRLHRANVNKRVYGNTGRRRWEEARVSRDRHRRVRVLRMHRRHESEEGIKGGALYCYFCLVTRIGS